MEPITIVMTTWFTDEQRLDIAIKAAESWYGGLLYDGDIHLHVADDGSILDYSFDWWNRGTVSYSRQERHGVGASLNTGFKKAFETSPYVLYMVDDWILQETFDITSWVELLRLCGDVGIVRLGPPHPHLFGKVEPITPYWQGWALRLDRHGLGVGHRPEIFHKRMTDYYGWFDEDVNAQECERLYSVRWAADENGPDIVLALPHPWFHYHLDVLPSTSHIDPKES